MCVCVESLCSVLGEKTQFTSSPQVLLKVFLTPTTPTSCHQQAQPQSLTSATQASWG